MDATDTIVGDTDTRDLGGMAMRDPTGAMVTRGRMGEDMHGRTIDTHGLTIADGIRLTPTATILMPLITPIRIITVDRRSASASASGHVGVGGKGAGISGRSFDLGCRFDLWQAAVAPLF